MASASRSHGDGPYTLHGDRTEHLSKRRAQALVQKIMDAIGAEKYVIHGWRYNAAAALAEAAATDAQIQSVTGHLTLDMVKKYRGRAERKRLSKEAQSRRQKTLKWQTNWQTSISEKEGGQVTAKKIF